MTISINPLYPGLFAAAPAGGKTAPNYCGPDEREHFRRLEENWQKREEVRQSAFTDSLGLIDQGLHLVDKEPKGAGEYIQGTVFNAGRRANFQTKNSLLLEASRMSLDMYFRSQGETSYLTKALKYLDTALANADTSQSHDIWRLPLTKAIHPVDEYFELQLARFQVLSLIDPGAAVSKDPVKKPGYDEKIKADLASRRVLTAQRSDFDHAGGYLNRLRILYGFAGLYNPAMDLNKAIASVREGRDWALMTHKRNLIAVEGLGMNKKDLRYDSLLARVIEGRLLIKAGRYGEAVTIFQSLLKEPAAVKKYGGFLDVGQQAFFGLMQISLATAGTLNQAAANFAKNIDWQALAGENMADLRESLGLVIRGLNWRDKTKMLLEQGVKREVTGILENEGKIALRLDWPGLAGPENSPVKYELQLTNCKTPLDKLSLFIKLLDYIDFPFDQKAALVNLYNMRGGRK
ncbi:MAG: hypothetical protein JW873_06395 [Candidatus Saganbacteria bacterium]|nr:hypothetical protein [Candidatus Saganbacteria bacterium]